MKVRYWIGVTFGHKKGSSVKWIDISHKLYKKAGIMYLCSDQTSRTWIPA